jgi:hypothetical protein
MKTFDDYLEAASDKTIKIKVFQYGKSWSAKFVSGNITSAKILLGPDADKNKAFIEPTKDAVIERLNQSAKKKNIDIIIV